MVIWIVIDVLAKCKLYYIINDALVWVRVESVIKEAT